MGGVTASRDSRDGMFRDCRGLPAIPAPPYRGRESPGGKRFVQGHTCPP
jgi:hypothetical protein